MKIRVVERSRWETNVRVRTMGMKVPRSPTAPESSEERLVLCRGPCWVMRGVLAGGECSSMEG